MSNLSEWVYSLAIGAILLIIGTGLIYLAFTPHASVLTSDNNQQKGGEDAQPTISIKKTVQETAVKQTTGIQIISQISALYITESDLAKLNNKLSTDNLEFRYCLFGESYKNGILITNIIEPEYETRTQYHLLATTCPSTSVGFIHSHQAAENCLLSSDDISTLNSESFPIQGVICEKNRITFYKKGSTNNFIPIYTVNTNLNNAIYSREITPQTACVGERFCNGQCWLGCSANEVWYCTTSGGNCNLDPNNCPSYAPYSCLGKCWNGCNARGVWSCTSQGGNCQY